MSDWIKFHGELRAGAKRGLPRAVRFIFLELSLLCRPNRGWVDLPLGMNALDGVHDLLGGNRDEVQDALAKLTVGTDPMVRIKGTEGALRLTIPSWSRWNAVDSSAARVQKHREKRRAGNAGNGGVTRYSNDCNDEPPPSVTLLDKSRVDQRRSDPPLPPKGGDGSPTAPGGAAPPFVLANPDPSPSPTKARPGKPKGKPARDPDAMPAHERYAAAYAAGVTDVSGKPFTPPTDSHAQYVFRSVLPVHALDANGDPLAGEALLAWIRASVAEWRRCADADRTRFTPGLKPSHWQTWLDEGCPGASAARQAALADPNDLPPTAVRYDRLPEPPVFREPRAEVIPSVVFGDDP